MLGTVPAAAACPCPVQADPEAAEAYHRIPAEVVVSPAAIEAEKSAARVLEY